MLTAFKNQGKSEFTPTQTEPGCKVGPPEAGLRARRPTEKALLSLPLTDRSGEEIKSKGKHRLDDEAESSRNRIPNTTMMLFYPLRN